MTSKDVSDPAIYCPALSTTFVGVHHPLSTPESPLSQFRGVKYASVPGRFRRSKLYTTYKSVTDAKEHGPAAPQLSLGTMLTDSLFGFPMKVPRLIQDEFECLNLVITSPGGHISKASLPVTVWIHGGGNVQGHGGSLMYDAGNLVRASIESRRPVIVVSINYRLGLFGFGASEALQDDNRLLGEGGVGNYGLYDQLNALTWVRSYIDSFGGDPSNITLFGESAGATNIHSMLMSRINQLGPVATRAIIQSGVVRPPAVQSVSSQGELLSLIMTRLDIKTVEELRNTAMDALVSHTPSIVYATDDGVFFKEDWRTGPTPEGISGIVIGDCMSESAVWRGAVSRWSTGSITQCIREVFNGVSEADAFLRIYGITSSANDQDARESALNIINDARYAWPTDITARMTSANNVPVYRYVFDQKSLWNSVAHHGIDLIYLFDNFTYSLPPGNIYISNAGSGPSFEVSGDSVLTSTPVYNPVCVRRAMQDRWIAFANGDRPWRQDMLYVFGPEGEVGGRELEAELSKRRRTEEWRKALDTMSPQVVWKVVVALGNGPKMDSNTRL